jgi:hypothetical protein
MDRRAMALRDCLTSTGVPPGLPYDGRPSQAIQTCRETPVGPGVLTDPG